MTNWDFPFTDPIDISIDSWASGSIDVLGEATGTVTVEVLPAAQRPDAADLLAQVEVGFDDGQLYVRGPRQHSFRRRTGLHLAIKAPAGSSCAARTVSADLSCAGELSALTVHTVSGDVTAPLITGDVTVQSTSGDVLLDRVGGHLTVHTASGDVQATQVDGAARVNTASGDVALNRCQGAVTARTASGDVGLGGVIAGRVELASASGDLKVAVVPGLAVYLDLASTSGDISSELDAAGDGDEADGPAAEISCRTLSGDIWIGRDQSGAGPATALARRPGGAGPADGGDSQPDGD